MHPSARSCDRKFGPGSRFHQRPSIIPALRWLVFIAAALASLSADAAEQPPELKRPRSLFDGKTLSGWEGDRKIWRVEDDTITGGSLTEIIKQNEFLASKRDYTNFVLRFKIKLTGTNGFINSGFQIRSQRVPNNSEMSGYQCDFGEPSWYGAIYDESRRNRLVAASDMESLRPVIRKDGWNDYVIRADGVRVTTWINGVLGVDYRETETSIPNFNWGKLGIQIHGGGKALVQVKDIFVEELRPTPPGAIFRGAPEPQQTAQHNEANRAATQTAAKAEPVPPETERASFSVAPGFAIELVAAEIMEEGIGKFVAVDWDQHGNLWTMTALEYPVDANETPAVAAELYASRGRDKVLVYDRDPKSPTGYAARPRIFADGLAIPLGLLPYKNGVYVQHGTDIVFLSDTNGDGQADKREVILTGFGVQDSHLFPHQFTRAPGGWIWFAQGAFNYGKVRTTRGAEVQFDQTRMAKFRFDGSDFDITSQGPCNIWGLAMTMEGETWIQEANDFGYPAMPFHAYANYPGCSQAQWKSYAPEFPATAPHFQVGGTGLSGLAISDNAGWPEAYRDVIYIANPITRKIQALKARREGSRYLLDKLPDFVLSEDEMFRPVALRLGPDGCLYIVDWYNKIISHNEVPRNHLERDKKRGRIWRVKPGKRATLAVPDFTKLPGVDLIAKLGGENTTQSHLAWQAIVDRQLLHLAPRLRALAAGKSNRSPQRVAALWALEGLKQADRPLLASLVRDPNRHLRREALRALAENGQFGALLAVKEAQFGRDLELISQDPEPEVRAELIRSAGRTLVNSSATASPAIEESSVAWLIRMAGAPIESPTMKSTQHGRTIKAGIAYDREFERYLARLFLEQRPRAVAAFLASSRSKLLPAENQLVAALALAPASGASRVAALLPSIERLAGQEELLRLAQFPDQPGVGESLKSIFSKPATSRPAIESLLAVRTRFDGSKLAPYLGAAAKDCFAKSDAVSIELGARLASGFQLADAEPDLIRVIEDATRGERRVENANALLRPEQMASLQALRELKSDRVELFTRIAARGNAAEQQAAVAALAASRNPQGVRQIATLYPQLAALARRSAVAALAGTKDGASVLVQAAREGAVAKEDLDPGTLEKLQTVLGGDDPQLNALLQDLAGFFRPSLRLNGNDDAWTDANITLDGAFTVETWVSLDPGIDNNDGILGAPGILDMNFFGSQFRVWVGGATHDAIVAKKRMIPNAWTHYAVTRDAQNKFRIYINGELDSAESQTAPRRFNGLRIGWTAPDKGTAGWLSEFRVWNHARESAEIRADFDRVFEGDPRPQGLVHYYPGAGPWGALRGGATVSKTSDYPPLLSATEARALAAKFEEFHQLASKAGDAARGKAQFAQTCRTCHSVGGQGGQIGPVLNAANALGTEALLRNLLTPNSAMEPGYRAFRVELKDGEVLDGFRVSENPEAIVLRRPNLDDTRISQSQVKRAAFTKLSLMPEGLLEAMAPSDVSDLFAYLKSLR